MKIKRISILFDSENDAADTINADSKKIVAALTPYAERLLADLKMGYSHTYPVYILGGGHNMDVSLYVSYDGSSLQQEISVQLNRTG